MPKLNKCLLSSNRRVPSNYLHFTRTRLLLCEVLIKYSFQYFERSQALEILSQTANILSIKVKRVAAKEMQIARSCYILLDLSYVQQPYFKLKPEIIEFLVILTRENA